MHSNKPSINNNGTFATFEVLKTAIAKVLKFILRIAQGLLVLIFLISVLTSIPAVQTRLAKSVAKGLSESLQTEVKIEYVSLSFAGKIHLEHVLVRDQEHDSLFYIDDLSARIGQINTVSQKVVLRSVVLKGALVNFKSIRNVSGNNYQFLIDYFSGPSGGGGGVWSIIFKDLELVDGSFRYKIKGYDKPTDRTFDENDFAFNHINGVLKDFYIVGDSLNFKVKNLSTIEKNGLRVKRMVCKAEIHYNGMSYKDLLLETDRSRLEDELIFSYKGFPMLSDFIDSVYFNVRLNESVISVRDLAYFSHNLNDYASNNILISGEAKGYVRRFKVKHFDIQVGNRTVLKGNIDLTGLPEWRSCFTDLDLSEFRTTPQDLQEILALDELPTNLNKFEDAMFAGHLTGFYTDFAADGVLSSTLGTLRSRINFKLDKDEVPRYQGQLVAEDFEVGYFLDQPNFGATSFTFDLEEGSGFKLAELHSKFKSAVDYLDFRGYRLNELSANGEYINKSFEGIAEFKDKNADFTFNGKMDFKPALPTYNFVSDIKYLNLKALKLDSIETTLTALLNIDLVGSQLDNLVGTAVVSDIDIKRGEYQLALNEISLFSSNDATGRNVELKSDIIDATIKGKYNFSYLDLVYQDILNTLFPDYYPDKARLPSPVMIEADINVRQNTMLGHFLQEDLKLGNGNFKGNYNSALKSLEVDGEMDALVWDNYKFEDYYLNIRKKPFQLLNMSTDVTRMFMNDKLLTHDILLNASIQPNDIDFLFNFADTTDQLALRSYGVLHFSKDTIGLKMMSSNIFTSGKRWEVNDNNQVWYTQNRTVIDMLSVIHNNQSIAFSGIISDKTNDRLEIMLNKLNLNSLNGYLSDFDIQTGGIASGSVSIFRLLDKPYVHANLNAVDLVYAGDTLGNFHVETESSENPLLMKISASVDEGLLKDVNFNGLVDLRDNKQKFDLNIEIKEASVKPFELIFKGVASDFEGSISGKARLKGTPELHTLKGKIDVTNVSFTVDYLQTRYFINDQIFLNDQVIDFKTLTIKDIYGNAGQVKGTIKHNLFSNFVLDLRLENIKNMLCLSTTAKDNSTFYGTGYASGKASFKGPLDNLVVDISATSGKGTKITIPIYDDTDNNLVEYIRFKAPTDTTKAKPQKSRRSEIDGLVVKMAFNVTNDAEFVLLFDETLDDRITGSGTGNVLMEYTSYEDFYMYGDIRIHDGIYPFSSPTLVSEKFDLREGGRIVWNGDPYNALIDLQASVARNRANPKDLMLGYVSTADLANYNTNIKMNVILYLKGELFSPDISFGMEFPDNLYTSGLTQFNSLIKKVENDPDELNRQVFSLLTFGSFTPTANYSLEPPTTNGINNIVSSSVGSFLSNQVNSWISEYDKNWEVGLDYKTRTGITDQEKAELIVSARRKLFNERLEVAGSYNAYTAGSINPYNVDLIYNLKKDGTLKLKAYHKLANDPTLGQVSNVTTTGVGFYFKKQFERIGFGDKSDEGIKPKEVTEPVVE